MVYTQIYTIFGGDYMTTAKLFTNGGSQAVRLPKDCRFDDSEVLVNRIGNIVMLIPKDDPWACFETGMMMFSDDVFADGRPEYAESERESLCSTCWIRMYASTL